MRGVNSLEWQVQRLVYGQCGRERRCDTRLEEAMVTGQEPEFMIIDDPGVPLTRWRAVLEPITIRPSATADTRTCDYATVSKETLKASSHQHIGDVWRALEFFRHLLQVSMVQHDTDKLTDLDGFHADFVTGFVQQSWWDRHRVLNRHHLTHPDGVPDDVNLIDVLDFVADCVMAGMGRSGSVYALVLSPELLTRAFQNTVTLLKDHVVVEGGSDAVSHVSQEAAGGDAPVSAG
jgi:hypothetical protein